MKMINMNKKAVAILEKWDPFQEGQKAYEPEIARVLAELNRLNHPVDLAKKIREIYEHSFKFWIPIEKCVQISYKLLALKYEAKSIV